MPLRWRGRPPRGMEEGLCRTIRKSRFRRWFRRNVYVLFLVGSFTHPKTGLIGLLIKELLKARFALFPCDEPELLLLGNEIILIVSARARLTLPAGRMPKFTSDKPNCASSAAMARSQDTTGRKAPPKQQPFTIAIVGFSKYLSRRHCHSQLSRRTFMFTMRG
jgi:hypothetical protein